MSALLSTPTHCPLALRGPSTLNFDRGWRVSDKNVTLRAATFLAIARGALASGDNPVEGSMVNYRFLSS
jgi:hypothetical protein